MDKFKDIPVELEPNEEQELNSGKPLNERQELFCHEYMVDFNGSIAAMRAGYKPYGASHTAYRLLRTAGIKKRIRELKKEHREQTNISFSFVIERLIRIADEAMEGDPVLAYDAAAKTWRDTGRKKPDRPTALKALSLLGKHIGMFDKEYTKMVEKEETDEQQDGEKQGQFIDAFMEACINLRESEKENQRLKAALAEAGIEVKPSEPEPVSKEEADRRILYMKDGYMLPMEPSENDDKPHYNYKHTRPLKNHPAHQLVSEEKMAEAIRKKRAQHTSGSTPDTETGPGV